MNEVSSAAYSTPLLNKYEWFFLFHPKSPNFYQKSVNSLLVDCFVTPKIFIIFVRHEYGLKMLFFGNPLQQFCENRRHCFKMEFNCACGMYKRKQRSELYSWIFKVHDHVCKHAIRICISLKHLPTDRRIDLMRHAYQQHVGLRWDLAHF